MKNRLIGFAAVLSLSAATLAQSDVPAPGFAVSDSRSVPFEADPCGFVGSSTLATEATLSDGRIVQFTGLEFLLLSSDGNVQTLLGTLPGAVFPSFVVVDPSETFAVAGESCNGDIFRVDLAGGGITTLSNLFFNYGATFNLTGDAVLVSAAATGAAGRNQIYRVDVSTGATTLRGRLAGFSGPVCLDDAGNLYYATQRPGAPVDLLRWSSATVASNVLLTESNATLVASGFDSGSGLAYDPVGGNVLLNEFYALRLIGPDGEERGIAATAGPGTFFGNVEILTGNGSGSLQPFQPANCELRYTATDFFSFGERRTSAPSRPVATLTGPTNGPATKTLEITGAHPGATVLVYFNDVGFLNPAEFVFGGDFPFHTALPPSRSRRIQPPLATDLFGSATFTYDDPGTLHGTLVFQAAVFDTAGSLVGTSTYALN